MIIILNRHSCGLNTSRLEQSGRHFQTIYFFNENNWIFIDIFTGVWGPTDFRTASTMVIAWPQTDCNPSAKLIPEPLPGNPVYWYILAPSFHEKRCGMYEITLLTDTYWPQAVNSSSPWQNGRHFADCIFNAFSWIKSFVFRFKVHSSLFLRIQLTISQHWYWGNGLAPNRLRAIN